MKNMVNEHIEMNIFDERVIYTDCTVEILRNSVTGQESVGWWRNDNPPKGMYDGE